MTARSDEDVLASTDAAWAAGFLDGEGAFQVQTRNQGRCKTRFVVAAHQVARAPLARLQGLWGGRIGAPATPVGNRRPVYEWTISGASAAAFIRSIRPYLQVKGPQADLMLKYAALPGAFDKGTPAGRGLSDEGMRQRRAISEAVRQLNRRGAEHVSA